MKQRILTGVIAGAAFLTVLTFGGWSYALVLLVLAVIGYFEYVRMNGLGWQAPAWIGLAGVLYFLMPWQLVSVTPPPPLTLLWLLLFLLFLMTVFSKNRFTLDQLSLLVVGILYIGYGFAAMLEVRLSENGLLASLLAFGCIWASDAGAYFSGRAFGRKKLWPAISPNKTIEGAIGGLVLALAVAAIFALFAPERIELVTALLIALICAVGGQAGDLVQSAYKRLRGIKDSGTLFPGHGGVLDRCDSWLIVFPLLLVSGLLI